MMPKIVFQYKPETIRKIKEMFPHDVYLHQMLDTNDGGVGTHLMNIANELSNLLFEANISTVEAG